MQKDGHVYLRVGEIFRVKNLVLRCKIACDSVHVAGTVGLLLPPTLTLHGAPGISWVPIVSIRWK